MIKNRLEWILLIIYIHKRFVSSTSSQTILIFLELKNSSDDLSKAHKFIDSNFQRSQVKKFSVNDDKIELIFKANLDNEKNLEEIELALKNLNITDSFSLSEELIIN